jgi:tetratricopeptide (TPR) repeat protein
MPRPPLIKLKISASKTFVNREKPLALFRKTAANIPIDNVELLVFYGVGGQGKTALRKQFEALLKNDNNYSNIHAAVLDLHERKTIDPDLALLFIRNELAQTKSVAFPAFDLVFSYYWQKVYPERKMPELANSWLEGGIDLTSDFIVDASKMAIEGAIGATAEGVPFIGGVLKRGVSYGVKWGHEQWSLKTNEAICVAFPQGVPKNPAEIEAKLPFLLASDLAVHLDKDETRRFVIFIDEYERVFEEGGFASKSRDNPFDRAMRELVTELKGALIIVMSREQLPWAEFAPVSVSHSEWRAWIQEAHHRLEGLSLQDAEKFLFDVPIPEESIRRAIIEGSGAKLGDGKEHPVYPLLLDLQVDHYINLKSREDCHISPEEFSIQADSFRDLRNKLFHRLLREYGPSFESTLKRLSVARYFDRGLFEFIVKKYATGFSLDRFTELTEMSFIEESKTEKLYKIHNSIREALQEYLSPDDLKNTHQVLIEYYTPRATPSESKSITDPNIDALIELVYHQCCFAPREVVGWWNEFSEPYIEGVKIRQIEPCLRLILESVEKHLEANHPLIATCLDNLATNLEVQGRHSEAQPLLERALKIIETALGPNHHDTATCLTNLAQNLDNQCRFTEAQALLERALNIDKNDENPFSNNPDRAIILASLAANLRMQDSYTEAQPFYERALKIMEDSLEPNDPSIATCLNNLAVNLENQGRYTEAQPMFERALKITESALGPDDLSTATDLTNLAGIFNNLGRYPEAQSLDERALKIIETTLGPNHPYTAQCLNILADNLDNQGRYAQAQPLYERSLQIIIKTIGSNSPHYGMVLSNLALNQSMLGNFSTAERDAEHAVKICTDALGNDAIHTVKTIFNLGNILQAQEKFLQAQSLFQNVLRIREIKLGKKHPETAAVLHVLAENFDAQQLYHQAQSLYERALEIREISLGAEHPDTVKTIKKLIENLDAQGQHEQAESYRKRIRNPLL